MAKRSLPERTVDAWVAASICGAFPNALIWGPTQRLNDTNWDYGVSLGDGKIFILEDKATTPVLHSVQLPLNTHRCDIPRDQLDWYCDVVEPTTGVPVYYVLPQPSWTGEPTGSVVVPDQSICRVTSPAGPFADWAWVIRCGDLRAYLGPAKPTLDTDLLPIPGSETLSTFLTLVAACQRGAQTSGPGDSATAVAKGEDPSGGDRGGTQRHSTDFEERAMVGSALAVFVPAQDL